MPLENMDIIDNQKNNEGGKAMRSLNTDWRNPSSAK